MSKKELVQILISDHLEAAEEKEVYEQLRLMLVLAPEWIEEKMSSTVDLLIHEFLPLFFPPCAVLTEF
ncbi:unnamed protein product [Lactuca virosa]|uniref:Uncharacterized protein n=1 Tax=Lactuca virosa TaxID=75947 RepID=A0AAU9LJ72_9ASTR|nr:unnamed protein product [Lactuca virosa]